MYQDKREPLDSREIDLLVNACQSLREKFVVWTLVDSGIASALEKRKPIMLVGFGTFGLAKRRARTVNYPQTGKQIRVAERLVPVFRPGTELKKRVAAKRGRGRPRRR